jgi:hypothetical protein
VINPTLDSNPLQLPSSIGSGPLDQSKDIPAALSPKPPVNEVNSQNSSDVFEQARIAFFLK